MAILISNKFNFRAKKITGERERKRQRERERKIRERKIALKKKITGQYH